MPDSVARSTFPNVFRALMKENGYNQNDIAEKLGVSKQTVSDWINGRKFPRVDKMQKLADLFGVLMSEMYNGNPHKENRVVVNASEMRLLSAYRAADPVYQAVALKMLEDNPHKKTNTESSAG